VDAVDHRALAVLLTRSLDALAGAGQTELACRIAGEACALLRKTDPAAARPLNAFLHRALLRPRQGN